MDKVITDDIAKQVAEMFESLTGPVEILYFQSKENCGRCPGTQQLVEEVAGLSDKLNVKIYDLEEDAEVAARHHVDKAPSLVLAVKGEAGLVDYGIRFVGAPAGHEFTTLIHDLLVVSKGETDLSEETRAYLHELKAPLLLQVFVTPSCPYCPQAVALAHQMAMESPWVQAEMVEATEFPALAVEFGVSGVPQTTINGGAGTVLGAPPEQYLLAEIQKAIVVE